MDAETVINLLGLEPHPEGEHYREVFRDPAVTAIYYLLKEGEVSAWRRAGAVEIWRHYDGAPLDLAISDDGEKSETQILGKNLAAGQRPQAYVPAGAWQAAKSLGAWPLMGCTVAPAGGPGVPVRRL